MARRGKKKETEVSDRLEALAKRGKPEATSTPRPTAIAGAAVQIEEVQAIDFEDQSPVSKWAKNIVKTRYSIVSNVDDIRKEQNLEAAAGSEEESTEGVRIIGQGLRYPLATSPMANQS